jgi:hypothetical protein
MPGDERSPKEAEVLRIHGGLRKYLQNAQYTTPEIPR